MAGKATVILNREELRVGFTIETEMSGCRAGTSSRLSGLLSENDEKI